jgi:tape measure domain-containing protein
MSTQVGSIHYDLDLDTAKFDKASENVSRKLGDLGDKFQNMGKKLSLFVTTPLVGAGGAAIKAASDFEQTTIAFETMLGSGEKAEKMLKDLTEFAVKTPFTLKGIEQSAKQLLAMGIESDKLIPTLKAMGDVSAGLSVELDRVAYNFGQVKAQGVLTGVELKDFARAGIPIIAELARNMGVTEAEVKDLVSAGKVGFAEVEKAFITMTSEGGAFNDLMQKQSQTTAGKFSNLQDSVELLGRSFGQLMLPAAMEVIKSLSNLVEVLSSLDPTTQKTILILAGLVAAIGPVLIVLGTMANSITAIITLMNSGFALAIAGFVKSLLFQAVPAVVQFAASIFSTAVPAIASFVVAFAPLIVTIGAVIAIIGALYFAWRNNFMGIRDFIGSVVNEFQRFWEKVRDLAAKIKEKLDMINPFHRESPSLVDNVVKGINLIKEEFSSLADIDIPPINAQIMPALSGASSSEVNQNINVNIDKVGDMQDVDAIGRELGFRASLMPGL